MAHPFDVSARVFSGNPFPVTNRVPSDQIPDWSIFPRQFRRNAHYVANAQLPQPPACGQSKRQRNANAPEAAYRRCHTGRTRRSLPFRYSATVNPDIRIVDLKRGTSSPLTFGDQKSHYPLWSRDGQRVFYHESTQQSQHHAEAGFRGRR